MTPFRGKQVRILCGAAAVMHCCSVADGTETTFQYTSKAATVGKALLSEGLITGDCFSL